jgi:hypothetical protein
MILSSQVKFSSEAVLVSLVSIVLIEINGKHQYLIFFHQMVYSPVPIDFITLYIYILILGFLVLLQFKHQAMICTDQLIASW